MKMDFMMRVVKCYKLEWGNLNEVTDPTSSVHSDESRVNERITKN